MYPLRMGCDFKDLRSFSSKAAISTHVCEVIVSILTSRFKYGSYSEGKPQQTSNYIVEIEYTVCEMFCQVIWYSVQPVIFTFTLATLHSQADDMPISAPSQVQHHPTLLKMQKATCREYYLIVLPA